MQRGRDERSLMVNQEKQTNIMVYIADIQVIYRFNIINRSKIIEGTG